MTGERTEDRTLFDITGANRMEFLQGLITNDVYMIKNGLIYAALLSPQGKYLADFFLCERGESVLLDVKSDLAEALARRLSMYKLRADVMISRSQLKVQRGLGAPPDGALADPRHPDLGWRYYGSETGARPEIDWDTIRVAHCVPESGIELRVDESYILESGFERLSGVDFKKGCYVGQEVTARMKHKTELRKGLALVETAAQVPVGSEIRAAGKTIGTLFTQSNGRGIAFLRFDRAVKQMEAQGVAVTYRA